MDVNSRMVAKPGKPVTEGAGQEIIIAFKSAKLPSRRRAVLSRMGAM
jgi:hypothetical protein